MGQLLMAAGFATTRAGVAAFLALTELAFSYLLGVTALGEPTSLLGGLGTTVVFGSVGMLAVGRTPAPRRAAPDGGDGSLAAADAQKEVQLEGDEPMDEPSQRAQNHGQEAIA